jgi:hypothetical protein
MSHTYKNISIFAPRFTFALRTTRAPSRNVVKFYQTVKLSTENLHLFHADNNVTQSQYHVLPLSPGHSFEFAGLQWLRKGHWPHFRLVGGRGGHVAGAPLLPPPMLDLN